MPALLHSGCRNSCVLNQTDHAINEMVKPVSFTCSLTIPCKLDLLLIPFQQKRKLRERKESGQEESEWRLEAGWQVRDRLTWPRSPTLADLYSAEPGEEEPAWVQTEREQFRDFRDLNKDGRLDGSEVGHWVLPPAQDQPLVEANHLLHESDMDKVGRWVAGRPWGLMPPGVQNDPDLGLELLGSLVGRGKKEGQRLRGWGRGGTET